MRIKSFLSLCTLVLFNISAPLCAHSIPAFYETSVSESNQSWITDSTIKYTKVLAQVFQISAANYWHIKSNDSMTLVNGKYGEIGLVSVVTNDKANFNKMGGIVQFDLYLDNLLS